MKPYHEYHYEGSVDWKHPNSDFLYKPHAGVDHYEHDGMPGESRLDALARCVQFPRQFYARVLGGGVGVCKCGVWHIDNLEWESSTGSFEHRPKMLDRPDLWTPLRSR